MTLGRLGRSLRHLVGLVDELAEHCVAVRSLAEGIDASTAAGGLTLARADLRASPPGGLIGGRGHARGAQRSSLRW